MKFLMIVLYVVCLTVCYAVVHDQITIRIAPEYFTVQHLQILPEASLTVLAAAWGVLAGIPAGLAMAFPIASAARNGWRRPPLKLMEIASSIAVLFAVMASVALCAGVVGWLLSESAADDPTRAQLLAVRWAHVASYLTGACGLGVLVWVIWHRRGRAGPPNKSPQRTGFAGRWPT